jgi:N-acetylglutamate synthase-like GNAT family acetyltransferase
MQAATQGGARMPMSNGVAQQVAGLINEQNQLAPRYTAKSILDNQEQYLVRLKGDTVLGAAQLKRVQWYQCEICHVSVGPKRIGTGTWLVNAAEAKARELGAGIMQCTIRVGNQESDGLFRKLGYIRTVVFPHERTGNDVAVYQKVLGIWLKSSAA